MEHSFPALGGLATLLATLRDGCGPEKACGCTYTDAKVLNMRPASAANDHRNQRSAHAVFASKGGASMLRVTRYVFRTDFAHDLCVEFDEMIALAFHRSPLTSRILIVVYPAALEEMSRVKTSPDVARMTSQRRRPVPIRNFEGESVNANLPSFKRDDCIPVLPCRKRPEKTRIRFVGLKRLKEPR